MLFDDIPASREPMFRSRLSQAAQRIRRLHRQSRFFDAATERLLGEALPVSCGSPGAADHDGGSGEACLNVLCIQTLPNLVDPLANWRESLD